MKRRFGSSIVLVLALTAALIAGCSEDGEFPGRPDPGDGTVPDESSAPGVVNPGPPPDLITVSFGGDDVTFWPYTGVELDGTPVDPVNLVFAGAADPVEIRAALLALDGNRTAFGFPDIYPFNATWSDAFGDVQASFADADGWIGSEVQLQLGTYDPVRWHLRLFRTGEHHGAGGWTLGAAHFELRIPGTADHQVLSWEAAEQMVMVDMMRTGLLDPSVPSVPTDVINAAPAYRTIPAIIYNGIPAELKAYIGGPAGPVSEDVPIPNDGRAILLNVAAAPAVSPGTAVQDFTMEYGLVVPKPFCSDGPYDFVYVSGPVRFEKTVRVTSRGHLTTVASYRGSLTITPWDIVANVPAGEPYRAQVGGNQETFVIGHRHFVFAFDRRLAMPGGGAEMLFTWLRASSPGADSRRAFEHCQD